MPVTTVVLALSVSPVCTATANEVSLLFPEQRTTGRRRQPVAGIAATTIVFISSLFPIPGAAPALPAAARLTPSASTSTAAAACGAGGRRRGPHRRLITGRVIAPTAAPTFPRRLSFFPLLVMISMPSTPVASSAAVTARAATRAMSRGPSTAAVTSVVSVGVGVRGASRAQGWQDAHSLLLPAPRVAAAAAPAAVPIAPLVVSPLAMVPSVAFRCCLSPSLGFVALLLHLRRRRFAARPRSLTDSSPRSVFVLAVVLQRRRRLRS